MDLTKNTLNQSPIQDNVTVTHLSSHERKDEKVLTIIIPTYNMEKYLRHCLDSLIVPNIQIR